MCLKDHTTCLVCTMSFLFSEGGQDVDEASTEQESQLEMVQTLLGQATGGGGLNGVVSDLVSALMDLVEVFFFLR